MRINITKLPTEDPIHVLWDLRTEILNNRQKGMRGVVLELGSAAKGNIVDQLCNRMQLTKPENPDSVTLTEVFGMEVKQTDYQPSEYAYVVIEGYTWAIVDTERGTTTKVTIDVLSLDGLNWKH